MLFKFRARANPSGIGSVCVCYAIVLRSNMNRTQQPDATPFTSLLSEVWIIQDTKLFSFNFDVN